MNEQSPITTVAAMQAPMLVDAIEAALAQLAGDPPPLNALPAPTLYQAALGGDAPLLHLCHDLDLSQPTLAALTLAAALEERPDVARQLRQMQGQAFGAWPALATLARLLPCLDIACDTPLPDLSQAFALGLLIRVGDRAPGPEERFALPPAMLSALAIPSAEPAIKLLDTPHLPATWSQSANALAQQADQRICLVLRQGEAADKLAFAAAIAEALGRQAVDVSAAETGAGVAANLANWLPVHVIKTSLGTRSPLPALAGYHGPRIAVIDTDGGLAPATGWQMIDAAPPAQCPTQDPLWNMGPSRRNAVNARIAAQPDSAAPAQRQRAALGQEYRAGMEPHAKLVPEAVTQQDFIASEETRRDLSILIARCHYALSGAASRTKGVKALLSGPSGTGKTLAASYLSTTLGLPLFRLDLSAVVSKYIGETEENLAQLLDHAESGHLVLLMDEADSLFAGRTEVTDSSARFANNQTNFLLTRFESFTGVALLTSNSPEKFDKAFARRLDQVIEVQSPAAKERRAILRHNLGPDHALSDGEVNRIAAMVDLSGGHLRNIVHTACVLATAEALAMNITHLTIGIAQEYRKLGRQPPVEFSA